MNLKSAPFLHLADSCKCCLRFKKDGMHIGYGTVLLRLQEESRGCGDMRGTLRHFPFHFINRPKLPGLIRYLVRSPSRQPEKPSP
jgi:hypothetical protein